LFSSNEEASRQVGQALLELDFAVDSCREIFAALEKLTTRSYELVVVDCNDGAEAAFLLKTAQDSKRNQSAFTVVLDDAGGIAKELTGIGYILRRPLICEQIKYDLLSRDTFLVAMRNWFSRNSSETRNTASLGTTSGDQAAAASEPQPVAAAIVPLEIAKPSPASTWAPVAAEPAAFDTLEKADANLPSRSDIQTLFATANAEAQSRNRVRPFFPTILCVGLVAGMLFADYVFDERPVISRVAKASSAMMHRVAERELSELNSSDGLVDSKANRLSARNAHRLGSLGDDASIRVMELRKDNRFQQPSPITNEVLREAESILPPVEIQSAAMAPIAMRPSIPVRPSVPDSLNAGARLPLSEHDSPSDTPSRLTRPVMPVNLATDLAEKLVIAKTQPSYPERALQAGLQGSVVLEALIGTDGMIQDLKLLSGPMLLGKAACDAVKQWRYQPYLLNGHAVEAQTLVTVDFKLP
jgi:TonB family protein